MSSYQGHRFGIATHEKGSSINQGLYHGAVNVFVDSRWYCEVVAVVYQRSPFAKFLP